ncbi:MAG TPA: hypothetical protein ENK48_06850 [Gammaproteobacteria bacterium]|nr:hypothetical protein [Gammaproteobacteria bacterium]
MGALLLGGCGGGEGTDPVIEAFGIAYVKRPLPEDPQTTTDLRDATAFNAGGDLFYRNLASAGAQEKNITFRETGGLGDVRDVESSYDGSKLLFAMRAPEIEGADPEDQPTWNIWEYDIASDQLRRIIASDITAEDGQDVAPHYLPDGRIVFSSTRQRQSKAILLDEGKPQFSALDERRDNPALVLHVMNADGSEIRQISFNQSHDLDPMVLESGEILFSRWDNMGSRNQISLYTMRPDGTELRIRYGAHSHATGTDGAQIQFIQPREQEDGRVMAIIKPFTGTDPGGDAILINTEDYIDNEQPTWQNQGMLSGPAQTPATINPVDTDPATPSPGGRFLAAYPLWDGSNRALVSWSPCRLMEGDNIVPCTADRLADPNAEAAPPLYGVYIYDMSNDTQLPIFAPQEGIMISEVVAAQSRTRPEILPDKVSGVELDPDLAEEGAGVLHIRSVYDFDGAFNDLGSGASDIASLADPAQYTADQRPARFLRVVKAVSIPDRDLVDLRGTAFGRSSQQLMREIIAYAPIEPDGSVRIKVPANVPLAVSVLDKNGRRIGARHQNWIQVRPGEELTCNGCHDHNSGLPHGHSGGPPAVNSGSQTTGLPFPNTVSSLFTDFGETMAQTRTRIEATALTPSVDIVYDDVWTDETAAGRPKDAAFAYSYSGADFTTLPPVATPCLSAWDVSCRIVINYEDHIHPLWGKDRGADTCTACHSPTDAMGNPRVPEAQLDLSDGASSDQPAHFTSYRELLFSDNEQELNMGALQDRLVQATDGNGNPLFEVDANGDPVLDALGNPVPVMVTVGVSPALSTAGAQASEGRFFSLFDAGGTHAGRLTPAELKLIAEWLDIGAQYYNNPFDVPPP